MPELPEVEVVKRELETLLQGQLHPVEVGKIKFYRNDLRDPIPIKKLSALEGSVLIGIFRRAKYLIFATEKGGLLSHLGMSGSWRFEKSPTHILHDHLRIELRSLGDLVFNDPRRFGIADFIAPAEDKKWTHKRFEHLGPEPLEQEFSAPYLYEKLRGKSTSIKAALMDQEIVVGIGNIYASEILHNARIHPLRKASKVRLQELESVVHHARKILTLSIAKGGSSIRDYRRTSGESGGFQNVHKVYDRAGEPCETCRTSIRMKVVSGRSTYWCPRCQPERGSLNR